jgi:rhodanese-related sulfurtransferase
MTTTRLSPHEVRVALLVRREIALVDVRDEARFATGHPLVAAQLPAGRIESEAPARIPRRDALVVVYDDGEGLVDEAVRRFRGLDYSNVRVLEGGLAGWRDAGFECFEDVNSYSKAFGELVEARRHTPSMTAEEVHALIEGQANIAVLDARRPDEYRTMTLPTSTSVPGAELVLRASALAPDPATTIVVHCAGRTRSIIGAQSLINAGIANRVVALRNGTIGWTLAGKALRTGQDRAAPEVHALAVTEARRRARDVSYRAGVRHIALPELAVLEGDRARSLYRFDVRSADEYAAGRIRGFASAPGGQLVQEIDVFAPVRGARIVLADDLGARADMTASWLAQMAWEVYVLDGGFDGPLETGSSVPYPSRGESGRYRRPYEGTEHAHAAMRAYLEWEFGLVDQLARDGTHGFFVI